MSGTTPAGTAGEREAAEWVRSMFARVARRYDLLNHLLSFNLDFHWRWRVAMRVRHILRRPGTRVLDLCCGTGDLLISLQAQRNEAVFGSDFCHPMLMAASAKIARRHLPSRLFESDALMLPLRGESLDLITIAFGFRNLANYNRGLAEMARVLRPSGAAAILEFSQPSNPVFAKLYRFYSGRILPVIGGILSGARDAYCYLPQSVSKFPGPAELTRLLREAGFRQVWFEPMTGGIVTLHLGIK